jgi:hypothetical protein
MQWGLPQYPASVTNGTTGGGGGGVNPTQVGTLPPLEPKMIATAKAIVSSTRPKDSPYGKAGQPFKLTDPDVQQALAQDFGTTPDVVARMVTTYGPQLSGAAPVPGSQPSTGAVQTAAPPNPAVSTKPIPPQQQHDDFARQTYSQTLSVVGDPNKARVVAATQVAKKFNLTMDQAMQVVNRIKNQPLGSNIPENLGIPQDIRNIGHTISEMDNGQGGGVIGAVSRGVLPGVMGAVGGASRAVLPTVMGGVANTVRAGAAVPPAVAGAVSNTVNAAARATPIATKVQDALAQARMMGYTQPADLQRVTAQILASKGVSPRDAQTYARLIVNGNRVNGVSPDARPLAQAAPQQ